MKKSEINISVFKNIVTLPSVKSLNITKVAPDTKLGKEK